LDCRRTVLKLRRRLQSTRDLAFFIMRKLLLVGLTLSVLALSACSKRDTQVQATPTPANTPDAARLKADSERLQQATANAAKAREQAATVSPTPTASP
jgi:hypothetical protein